MKLILTVLVASLMTGCASQPAPDLQPAPATAPAPKPAVNLSGYPPEFKQGYSEGCASAKPNAVRTRNEERFKTDVNYAQGWRDGYDICGRQK